jgi:DinB superfamily
MSKAEVTRRRPEKSEYVEYYHRYVQEVPDGDIVAILKEQLSMTSAFLKSIPVERIDFRYAPGKWTLREVVGHIIDMEWVFGTRALHFARTVSEPLPGVEQDDFVVVGNFSGQAWPGLIDQYRHLRSAHILLFEGFDDAAWNRSGVAADNRFTVRAFPYIIAGHERHHVGVLRERYL